MSPRRRFRYLRLLRWGFLQKFIYHLDRVLTSFDDVAPKSLPFGLIIVLGILRIADCVCISLLSQTLLGLSCVDGAPSGIISSINATLARFVHDSLCISFGIFRATLGAHFLDRLLILTISNISAPGRNALFFLLSLLNAKVMSLLLLIGDNFSVVSLLMVTQGYLVEDNLAGDKIQTGLAPKQLSR